MGTQNSVSPTALITATKTALYSIYDYLAGMKTNLNNESFFFFFFFSVGGLNDHSSWNQKAGEMRVGLAKGGNWNKTWKQKLEIWENLEGRGERSTRSISRK